MEQKQGFSKSSIDLEKKIYFKPIAEIVTLSVSDVLAESDSAQSQVEPEPEWPMRHDFSAW